MIKKFDLKNKHFWGHFCVQIFFIPKIGEKDKELRREKIFYSLVVVKYKIGEK